MTRDYAARLVYVLFCLIGLAIFWANFIAQKHLVRERVQELEVGKRRFAVSWPDPSVVDSKGVYWIYMRRCGVGALMVHVAVNVIWHS
jgi:hypothetical protein